VHEHRDSPGALRAASRGRSHRLADDIAGRVLFDAATARRRTLDAGRTDTGGVASLGDIVPCPRAGGTGRGLAQGVPHVRPRG
jgi:putative flavoprotein involved in K+ transport